MYDFSLGHACWGVPVGTDTPTSRPSCYTCEGISRFNYRGKTPSPPHTVLDPELHKRRKQGQHHQVFIELFFLAVDATKPDASSPCHSDFPSEVDCNSTCLPKTRPSFLNHLGQVFCYSKETITETAHKGFVPPPFVCSAVFVTLLVIAILTEMSWKLNVLFFIS